MLNYFKEKIFLQIIVYSLTTQYPFLIGIDSYSKDIHVILNLPKHLFLGLLLIYFPPSDLKLANCLWVTI